MNWEKYVGVVLRLSENSVDNFRRSISTFSILTPRMSQSKQQQKLIKYAWKFSETVCRRLNICECQVDTNLEKDRGLDSRKRFRLRLLSFQTITNRKKSYGNHFLTVFKFNEIVCFRVYIFNGPVDTNLEKERGLDSRKSSGLRLLSFQAIPNKKKRSENKVITVCESSEIVCCRVYICNCPVDTNLEKEHGWSMATLLRSTHP